MDRKEWVFDMEHAQRLTRARQEFLKRVLPELIGRLAIKTALDLGCGVGYFSNFLKNQGLKVVAVDGREDNVQEAKTRFPTITFYCMNVEDTSIVELGSFDLVLCFGLLYHLENPFQAVRNFFSLTGKLLLIESVFVPDSMPRLLLRDEGRDRDQGLNYVAFYPTESAIVKMCYRAGFPFVYRFSQLPEHEDFHGTVFCKRRRTMIAASKERLDVPFLVSVPEPIVLMNPWKTYWGKIRDQMVRVGRLWRRLVATGDAV